MPESHQTSDAVSLKRGRRCAAAAPGCPPAPMLLAAGQTVLPHASQKHDLGFRLAAGLQHLDDSFRRRPVARIALQAPLDEAVDQLRALVRSAPRAKLSARGSQVRGPPEKRSPKLATEIPRKCRSNAPCHVTLSFQTDQSQNGAKINGNETHCRSQSAPRLGCSRVTISCRRIP